jgi:hypothetical protein
MKTSEAVLDGNPAEPDQTGLDEMAAVLALFPGYVSVIISRGATLLEAGHYIPGDAGQEFLRTGLADSEKVYAVQKPCFDTLGGHARGELPFGIAEAYLWPGDEARAGGSKGRRP